eukprot:1571383-Rhodomonas_salina.1
MAKRQSVRMARGWEAGTALRVMAMAAYSPLIGTASPPTRPDKRRLSPISGPMSRWGLSTTPGLVEPPDL